MKFLLVAVVVGLVELSAWQEPQKTADEKASSETKTETKPETKPTEVANVSGILNPVKSTPESLALGKKAYTLDCAMCHGKDGAGDGDLAADMKLKLKDYREAATLEKMKDDELFNIILNGKGRMTGEEGRMKPPQIWNVVNYVRSLAKSKT